jgi:hypothetical protein
MKAGKKEEKKEFEFAPSRPVPFLLFLPIPSMKLLVSDSL